MNRSSAICLLLLFVTACDPVTGGGTPVPAGVLAAHAAGTQTAWAQTPLAATAQAGASTAQAERTHAAVTSTAIALLQSGESTLAAIRVADAAVQSTQAAFEVSVRGTQVGEQATAQYYVDRRIDSMVNQRAALTATVLAQQAAYGAFRARWSPWLWLARVVVGLFMVAMLALVVVRWIARRSRVQETQAGTLVHGLNGPELVEREVVTETVRVDVIPDERIRLFGWRMATTQFCLHGERLGFTNEALYTQHHIVEDRDWRQMVALLVAAGVLQTDRGGGTRWMPGWGPKRLREAVRAGDLDDFYPPTPAEAPEIRWPRGGGPQSTPETEAE